MLGRVLAGSTGCGVAVRGTDLVAVAVRVERSGVAVIGRLRIPGFAERPPEEWGLEYEEFLRERGIKKKNASLCMPREDFVLRTLDLPPMPARELDSSVAWQVPDLHPFGDDPVLHDWVRPQGRSGEPVAQKIPTIIARNATVNAYEGMFATAGIPLSACTVAASALAAATSLHTTPPSNPMLIADIEGTRLELFGRSAQTPVWSAAIDLGGVTLEGALRLALEGLPGHDEGPPGVAFAGAEVPSEPATGLGVVPLRDVLPEPVRAADEFDLARDAVAYATAIEAARPRSGLRLNLLPASRRPFGSLRTFAPTLALVLALALVGGAHFARGMLQDRNYAERLQEETARLEADADAFAPDNAAAADLEDSLDWLRHRRNRAAQDLVTLREISRILPQSTWLTGLTLDNSTAVLTGVATNANPLLGIVDASSSLAAPRFSMAPARGDRGENFQIEATRR